MASVNKVILIGNVGKDPDIRYTQAGEPIANFSLATSESWTDRSGQKQEKTEWHKVVVFGKPVKVVQDYVTKGSPLYVEGAIVYGSYTNKDGNKVNTTEIQVKGFNSCVKFLGRPGGGKRERDDDGYQPGSSAPASGEPADSFVASDEDVPF